MPRRPFALCVLPIALLSLGSALSGPAAAWADSPKAVSDNPGAYLAARLAASSNDFAAAAKWYDQALAADPANPALLEGAVNAYLAIGNITIAAERARPLVAGGAVSQIANIAILAQDARNGDFDAILTSQKAGKSLGPLVDNLVVAWAEVGTGKMSEALDDFDKIMATPGMEAFGTYHKALALASTGDYEGADKLLSGPAAPAVTQLRRGLLARVQVLSQLERNTDAVALIDQSLGPRLDSGMADLRRRLDAGEPVAFDAIGNAREGLAEVFFTLATALAEQSDDTFTLINARVAAALRPGHVEAQLMAARILQKLLQYDLATQALATIPDTDPAYVVAVIGQAQAAISADRLDDAVTLLQTLALKQPADIDVQTALGDALQRQDHCDLAIRAYDAAITALGTPSPNNWPLFYKRANCNHANNDWPAAEADYRMALQLDPNEPRLLNELGYSYVDRGEHLDEALTMIQKAVSVAPDSGFIVDSLAWAYYRLGRYDDAISPMEKASLLMPLDPIVTDHLGDVYWQVGRKREAQFQWRRALSYNPDEADAIRIRHKLAVGLDAVLKEEKTAGN